MAEAAEPLRISMFSTSFGLRSAMRFTGDSWLTCEIPDPAARVTLFVPDPMETSLTITPSIT